nr:glycosyltransferase family 4 protein [Dissulfurirhabdus thermomarina]
MAGLRDEARRAWGLPPEAVVFALVAHNFALKGVDALVRAAERLAPGRDVRFLVAGRGRPGPYLRRARPEARRRFVFTGPVPEVERVYAAADAYVHPTWYDPCSLVVLEAMAGGLPVVTTRFNGAGELVEEGVAGVVLESPADLEGLARALGDLLDGDRRRAMGRAARRIAERHPWSRHFTELRRILLEAGP